MATPKPKPKPSVLRGKAAIDEFQKQISPKGMAEAEAAAQRALELKYPGVYETKIRNTAGLYRSK